MFKIGDRVQLTAEALKLCDPAITEAEMKGTVLGFEKRADYVALRIRYDDGNEDTHPAHWFKLEQF